LELQFPVLSECPKMLMSPNTGCGPFLESSTLETIRRRAYAVHLHLIHHARLRLVQEYLPSASIILDLGGANAPLYRMGYPHPFTRLTLLDLPPEERHADWKEAVVEKLPNNAEVVLRYCDMTSLVEFDAETVDLVWAGQSIEHVTLEQGIRMCEQSYRVLRKGGSFCLDTPNRRLTEIHTKDIGGGFIHPDHKLEFYPSDLRRILLDSGFSIECEKGICHMPMSALGSFHYEDFILGDEISDDIEGSYIQYFHARKS
jgi:SAM-dependent methyltransferase